MVDYSGIAFETITVRTWYLYYNGNIPALPPDCILSCWSQPEPNDYLSLYKRVGEQWGWTGRLLLTPEALSEKLNSAQNEVWLYSTAGLLSGFIEIDRSVKGKAEIVYLGLLPEMIGKGLGKQFMEAAIAIASGQNGDQVWLHTCEYDHPRALEIYLKAGFAIEKEMVEEEFYPVDFMRKRN